MAGKTLRVAAVQFAPVYMDRSASAEKMAIAVKAACDEGAELVVLPECGLAGYPPWPENPYQDKSPNWFDAWELFVDQAVTVPGPEVDALSAVARQYGSYLVVGINERDSEHRASIFNTALLIGPGGEVVGRHRKIAPVVHELLYFSRGDARDLRVFDTAIGKVGLAICYENLNPLYRFALSSQDELLHCALWTTGHPSTRGIVDASTRQAAMEARCFVIASSQVTPGLAMGGWSFIGGSAIVGPDGAYLAGPMYDEEGLLIADLDLAAVDRARARFHNFGKDARFDLLRLWQHPDALGKQSAAAAAAAASTAHEVDETLSDAPWETDLPGATVDSNG